jgi:hypothetical protein
VSDKTEFSIERVDRPTGGSYRTTVDGPFGQDDPSRAPASISSSSTTLTFQMRCAVAASATN